MAQQKVSVITRCKNRRDHVRCSLPTVLRQTHKPIEAIIVNYDSQDDVHEMLWTDFKSYMESGQVKEVYVKDRPIFHPAHAQNVGIKHATGDWLMFMDADNLMMPHFISHLVSRLGDQPRVFARPMPSYMHQDKAGQTFARREDIEHIGGFLETLTHGWGYEDGDILDRLILLGLELFNYSNTLTEVIEHAEEARTGAMVRTDRGKSQLFNVETARKNKMWNGCYANVGVEWGQGGVLVTNGGPLK